MAAMDASLISAMAPSLIQPVASSLINAIKWVMRVEKGQEGGFLPSLALPLWWIFWEKESWMKNVSPAPSFNQIWDYQVFQLRA